MSRPRTLGELQDALDTAFAWRLKELADLKSLVRKSDVVQKKTAIRAAVCVAYAHWEGFVKESAEQYIRFVANQRLVFNDLADCFVVFGVKRHVSTLTEGRKAAPSIEVVKFFRNNQGESANISLKSYVDTESNLNSVVFENIAASIGIDPVPFNSRYHQIDSELLARRNKIAHGDYLTLDATPCGELLDDVIALLRQFKTAVETAASSAAFRR